MKPLKAPLPGAASSSAVLLGLPARASASASAVRRSFEPNWL